MKISKTMENKMAETGNTQVSAQKTELSINILNINTMKRIKQIFLLAALCVCGTIGNSTTTTSGLNSINSKVIVAIRGNIKNVDYNGQRQSVIGYSVAISNSLYTTEDFVSYATDSVSATEAGTYAMGISSSDFCNVNPAFKNVEFVVFDGRLSINDNRRGCVK